MKTWLLGLLSSQNQVSDAIPSNEPSRLLFLQTKPATSRASRRYQRSASSGDCFRSVCKGRFFKYCLGKTGMICCLPHWLMYVLKCSVSLLFVVCCCCYVSMLGVFLDPLQYCSRFFAVEWMFCSRTESSRFGSNMFLSLLWLRYVWTQIVIRNTHTHAVYDMNFNHTTRWLFVKFWMIQEGLVCRSMERWYSVPRVCVCISFDIWPESAAFRYPTPPGVLHVWWLGCVVPIVGSWVSRESLLICSTWFAYYMFCLLYSFRPIMDYCTWSWFCFFFSDLALLKGLLGIT